MAPKATSTSIHRPFTALHPKDQQIKQTKKLCIEKNWKCPIDQCLTPAIRPRVEVKKGAKARVDDKPRPDEKWWNWSVELLKTIEELSVMTENDLEFARQILEIEVENRQNNPKSSQRKVLELLLGDAQKVVDEQRKRVAVRYATNGRTPTGNNIEAQYHATMFPHTPGAFAPTVPSMQTGSYHASNGVPALSASSQNQHRPQADRLLTNEPNGWSSSPQQDTGTKRLRGADDVGFPELREHLDHTEARAYAIRLRAKAIRLEADMAKMEAESAELEAEARELREALDSNGPDSMDVVPSREMDEEESRQPHGSESPEL